MSKIYKKSPLAQPHYMLEDDNQFGTCCKRPLQSVSRRSWIDDITQRCEQTRQKVLDELKAAGTMFIDEMNKLDLTVSSKSAVTCCDRAMEEELAQHFWSARGLKVTKAAIVRDLGLDRGRGVRSRRPTTSTRKVKARLRAKRARPLGTRACLGRMAQKHVVQAEVPQEAYD